MGTLRTGSAITYFKEDGVVYGEYDNGDRFIVGGESLGISNVTSSHITQSEYDYIKYIAENNQAVEALLRKFSKEIRGYY